MKHTTFKMGYNPKLGDLEYDPIMDCHKTKAALYAILGLFALICAINIIF